MNSVDFVICLVVAALAGAAIQIGWYGLASFTLCLFVLVLVNISLFHFQLPQPRYIATIEIEEEEE